MSFTRNMAVLLLSVASAHGHAEGAAGLPYRSRGLLLGAPLRNPGLSLSDLSSC